MAQFSASVSSSPIPLEPYIKLENTQIKNWTSFHLKMKNKPLMDHLVIRRWNNTRVPIFWVLEEKVLSAWVGLTLYQKQQCERDYREGVRVTNTPEVWNEKSIEKNGRERVKVHYKTNKTKTNRRLMWSHSFDQPGKLQLNPRFQLSSLVSRACGPKSSTPIRSFGLVTVVYMFIFYY